MNVGFVSSTVCAFGFAWSRSDELDTIRYELLFGILFTVRSQALYLLAMSYIDPRQDSEFAVQNDEASVFP